MRKLTLRDLLATLITAAVVMPFVGYSVRGLMPLMQDPWWAQAARRSDSL